ncbi:IS3 family transposase [Limosilactobacillus fermentum]|uniref:IS3 family transposase n=2 Tax=Limosilactobacillus fermentum TaxID=1613 RepID=UPI003AF0B01B
MDVQHALESHPSINGMCDYVGISRSGYYQREKRHNHQSPRKLRKKFIQGEIKAIWLKSLCIYGAGKITQELRSKGYKIAERTVGKYMRELGIHAVYLTAWSYVGALNKSLSRLATSLRSLSARILVQSLLK